jgi:hypothetical protein
MSMELLLIIVVVPPLSCDGGYGVAVAGCWSRLVGFVNAAFSRNDCYFTELPF